MRLANVDAPERGQRGAAQAREALRDLLEGEKVRIVTIGRDKYGRSVANVYVGRRSVNKSMRKLLKSKR